MNVLQITDIEAAWLAGLLEGEGCFGEVTTTNPYGKRYRYPTVQCTSTDRDVIWALDEEHASTNCWRSSHDLY